MESPPSLNSQQLRQLLQTGAAVTSSTLGLLSRCVKDPQTERGLQEFIDEMSLILSPDERYEDAEEIALLSLTTLYLVSRRISEYLSIKEAAFEQPSADLLEAAEEALTCLDELCDSASIEKQLSDDVFSAALHLKAAFGKIKKRKDLRA